MTDEGVQGLKGLAARMREQVGEISQVLSTIESELESNAGGLGPHANSIRQVIEMLEAEVKSASSPINELAEKVDAVAQEYQAFIDDDRFANGGN